MSSFELKYLFVGQINNFRDNLLYRDIKPSIPYSKLNKENNTLFYKIFCILSLIYVLFLQIKSVVENSPSAYGMGFITLFYFCFVLICWRTPILKIKELGSLLSPFLLFKLRKLYPDKSIPLISIMKIVFKRIAIMSFLVISVLVLFECGKLYSNFSYEGKFWCNFFNDAFFLGHMFSANLFLNYFLIVSVLSCLLAILSNPFYCFERMLIRKKVEQKGYLGIVLPCSLAIYGLFAINPNYQLYLIKSLNEVFLGLVLGVIYLILFLFAAVYFDLIFMRKNHHENKFII